MRAYNGVPSPFADHVTQYILYLVDTCNLLSCGSSTVKCAVLRDVKQSLTTRDLTNKGVGASAYYYSKPTALDIDNVPALMHTRSSRKVCSIKVLTNT